ncbi:hypothetical protein [Nostoc sp. UHCC 0251]|uniref:hypothetical protein n=1 Tax=Nostoc sp. UHCC 0251 TaxID=3110240 RepID=UPI002B20A0E2|nr:hypothetical protein [Nostoc sp. UHCC 0251]MEA5623811.1 hypothetical protein [Nostoc sp. UHCC 0251]
MSSVYVTGLSYVNINGAGGSINLRNTSPTGLTINDSEEIFVTRAKSNRTSVEVTDSFIRYDGSDLLLGGKGNNTLVGDLDTDTLIRGADDDLLVLEGSTSTPLLTDVITDFNTSGGNSIGISANNNSLKDLIFAGFDSTSDGFNTSLVQYQDSFLDGISSFYF